MTKTSHSYFVVMLSYPARYSEGVRVAVAGQEAIVDPEITRGEVVSRIRSGEYAQDEIVFIHHVDGLYVEDVTTELTDEAVAGLRTFDRPDKQDAINAAWDRSRALRNEAV